MTMTDPLGDMLTRIRNGQRVGKRNVRCPASNLRGNVLAVLTKEGYIRGYEPSEDDAGKPAISIELKYQEGAPVIRRIGRVSKPGRRVYSGVDSIPRPMGGLGIAIVSTSKGVLSDRKCRELKVGGEILCTVC